jgi:hypothetical protein
MTADEAGAAGNQKFQSLMFPPRREDAKSFFGPLRPSPAHPIQSLRDGANGCLSPGDLPQRRRDAEGFS